MWLGLILAVLFWMKSLISKQHIFNISGFLPELMIFQKILRATIFEVEGCAFGFWPFTSKTRPLLKKNIENILW